MSSSWDPEREGSALGIEEFQKNVDNIKEGLGRSRENTVLREKLSGLSDAEVSSALSDLERRETAASKRQQKFSDKLSDDLK